MIIPGFTLRDFRNGVYRKSAVNAFLVPANSVSHAINVNFDQIIGSGVVRAGTTLLGSAVASNKTPLGLAEFVGQGGTPNLLLSVFSGASTATIYYYDTSWHASGTTNLSNTANNRFDVLGGRAFRVNGVDAMSSSADGATWATTDCITTDSVVPSLVYQFDNRLLASGDTTVATGHSKSRIFFSSIIDPNNSPFITWNTNLSTGDFIDVNPDDGDNVTAFSSASGTVIVFKTNHMYRMDTIAKSVDVLNIIDVGAVSQEAVTTCQGIVYFFSGIDIRQTNGGYPDQISRLGVQDFVDAIPQANWSAVNAGSDGFNVYFSIGNVTLNTNKGSQVTYTNVALKFSPRDQNWSVWSTGQRQSFYAKFTTSADGRKMVEADTTGSVQTVNKGTTDNGTAIFFDLQTQEQEFGNRANTKQITKDIAVFNDNGLDAALQIQVDGGDWIPVDGALDARVNVMDTANVEAHFFVFRWTGTTTGNAPTFEGIYLQEVTDLGLVH